MGYFKKKSAFKLLKRVMQCIAVSIGFAGFANTPAHAGSLIHEVKEVPAPKGAVELCQRYQWACDRSRVAKIDDAQKILKLASKVNASVNRSTPEISDQLQYGQPEVWALPTGRGGDCEDFALIKKRELIRLGVAPFRLLIATGLDRNRNSHAVLIVRTNRGDYVLDNLTNKMKRWDASGISFFRMQDPNTMTGWTLVARGGIFPT